jgi:hypothetical protein
MPPFLIKNVIVQKTTHIILHLKLYVQGYFAKDYKNFSSILSPGGENRSKQIKASVSRSEVDILTCLPPL